MSLCPKGLLIELINKQQSIGYSSFRLCQMASCPPQVTPLSSPNCNVPLYIGVSRIRFITHITKDRSVQLTKGPVLKVGQVLGHSHGCH